MGISITFWGSLGSLPLAVSPDAIEQKINDALWTARSEDFKSPSEVKQYVAKLPFSERGTYKGNTTCVQLNHGDSGFVVLCDAGTGLKNYSDSPTYDPSIKTYHLFISHLHLDHIQGFPFFKPIYEEGNTVIIHTFHKEIEVALRGLFEKNIFPVEYDSLKATIVYDMQSEATEFQLGALHVQSICQNHPSNSWGYRFEQDDEVIVFSTDAQHNVNEINDIKYPFIRFIENADILIFDAQYSPGVENASKGKWGHSDLMTAIKLAAHAKVKKLTIMHHDPCKSDALIELETNKARKLIRDINNELGNQILYPRELMLAYDNLTVEV